MMPVLSRMAHHCYIRLCAKLSDQSGPGERRQVILGWSSLECVWEAERPGWATQVGRQGGEGVAHSIAPSPRPGAGRRATLPGEGHLV